MLLCESAGALRARIHEVLLTALAQALRNWTGSGAQRIDLEGHGREELAGDLSLARTVGWCTSLFPVQLELPAADEAGACLKAIKEQLRAVPANGLGYGLLRYLREDAPLRAELTALPAAEIGFNYLGQTDAATDALDGFRWSAADPGPAQAPDQPRPHAIEINCRVQDHRLHADWQFSERLHRPATIARVAAAWCARLEALAVCARRPGADVLAPSDFKKIDLTANELDALLGEVDDGNKMSP
jgi:non-ribosomal peptide synthase protein (TIGR01720 family)